MEGLARELRKLGQGYNLITRDIIKPIFFSSTVYLLVRRFQAMGVLFAVPILTSVQYALLKIESKVGSSAELVKFDLSTENGSEEKEEAIAREKSADFERNKQAALRMRRIVNLAEELKNPSYIPPPWAADTWLNLGLYMLKAQLYMRFSSLHTETVHLAMEDGGEVTVEVSTDPSLTEDAPVMIILHTITGSSKESRQYMKEALRRGWRGIVFDRRGHLSKLRTAGFNLMGDAQDTIKQVEYVKRRYPDSFLGMIGISAGSGLLVNYLGKQNVLTPVQAACCLCPAYDISKAFQKLSVNYPLVDKSLLKGVKRLFIHPNSEVLGMHCFESLEMCVKANTLDEFMRSHAVYAGCTSAEDYFKQNNPMEWIGQVSVPLLVVNSEDDMVCLPQNIREDLFKYKYGNALLLKTKRGSHIAYNEGMFGTGDYLPRISLEFLQAARNLYINGELELS